MLKWLREALSRDDVPTSVSQFRCSKLTVSAEVLYDSDASEFVIGYSHKPNRFTNVGRSAEFSEAAKELSSVIDSSTKLSPCERKSLLDGAESTPLETMVYHSKADDEYIIVVSDGDDYITARGRNMSRAFADFENAEITLNRETNSD